MQDIIFSSLNPTAVVILFSNTGWCWVTFFKRPGCASCCKLQPPSLTAKPGLSRAKMGPRLKEHRGLQVQVSGPPWPHSTRGKRTPYALVTAGTVIEIENCVVGKEVSGQRARPRHLLPHRTRQSAWHTVDVRKIFSE